MITFREHLEISKIVSDEQSISEYIENLPLSERIDKFRSISSVYPLKDMDKRDLSEFNSFNYYLSIDELVLGQFIMLEQIITGKTSFETEAENDLAIASLLIRPKHHIDFDNSESNEEEENKENILNSDVRDIYAVLTKFLKNRDYVLFKQFAGVFYEIPDEEDEDEDSLKEKTAEQVFQQQWYWYSMVRMLAKEDITRYSDIYMLKMSTVMPEMSFLAQKNKIESARQRQAEAMRKL